jgi:hydroxymethylbilane synthase
MSASIFFTRDIEHHETLNKALLALGCEVIGQALIATQSVDLPKKLPATDWIFFSSKHGVHHFFAQNPKVKATKFAAIGEGTARELRKHTTVHFTGSAADTALVAAEFQEIVGLETVLFPVSDQSIRTVQQAIPSEQVHDVICYTTAHKPAQVGHPDIVVFSSPSNVYAFFEANTLLSSQRAVAFGKSTARALEANGVMKVSVAKGATDSAILDAIKAVL